MGLPFARMCSCTYAPLIKYLKCKAWHLAESCKKCHVSSDSLGCGGKVIIKYVHLAHMPTLGPLVLLQHLDSQYVAPCHLPEGGGRCGGAREWAVHGRGTEEEIGEQIWKCLKKSTPHFGVWFGKEGWCISPKNYWLGIQEKEPP